MSQYFVDKPASLKNDLLSGFTVAIAIIPEALVFSYLAGVPAYWGIFSALLLTLISSLIGGRPGMITGITGTLAVVMVRLSGGYGIEYLFAAIALGGLLQIALGALKLGKFIRLLPRPVVLGFISGMAISILIQQSDVLTGAIGGQELGFLSGTNLYLTLGLVLLGLGIILFFPYVTKAIPSSLVAIGVIWVLVWMLNIDTPTIQDLLNSLSLMNGNGDSSSLHDPPYVHLQQIPWGEWEFYQVVIPSGIMIAVIGLTQSLVTINFLDELTGTRGNANKECVAQGVGNLLASFLGVPAGGALLSQSVVNVKSGGRFRLSGIAAAITLVLFVVLGGDIIGKTPVVAVASVMIMMVIGTVAWSSIRILNKIKRTDAFILIFVSGISITFNETAGVLLGVVFSALVFAWENAIRIRVRKKEDENGVKHYEVYGPLFFGSSSLFVSKFDGTENEDKNEIVLNFVESRVWDHSGIEAIYEVAKKLSEAGKKVQIIHLSRDSRLLLKQTGVPENVEIIENPSDPLYKVVTNFPTEH